MPAFVDTAKITVKAGNGGNGAVAFHREKYVAAGGPDGGDGGRGGDILLQVDRHMSTLMDFRYKRKYAAGNGMDGQGRRCSGKDGQDLVIKVPLGTVVRDADTNQIICDMSSAQPFVLARGATAAGATSTSPPPPARCPGLPRRGSPARSARWYWS